MSKLLLVKKILERPHVFDWTIQGLGMLRLSLSREVRLHVWHPNYRVPNVTDIHDHPWDFTSEIVAGELTNTIYTAIPGTSSPTHTQGTIRCGAGCHLRASTEDDIRLVELQVMSRSYLKAGQSYNQSAHEIHCSEPAPGTVTIISRLFHKDTEHAHVFWPAGQEWVSAEPRPATPREVDRITQFSLMRWF